MCSIDSQEINMYHTITTYPTWGVGVGVGSHKCGHISANHYNNKPPEWREAIKMKCQAQGHNSLVILPWWLVSHVLNSNYSLPALRSVPHQRAVPHKCSHISVQHYKYTSTCRYPFIHLFELTHLTIGPLLSHFFQTTIFTQFPHANVRTNNLWI